MWGTPPMRLSWRPNSSYLSSSSVPGPKQSSCSVTYDLCSSSVAQGWGGAGASRRGLHSLPQLLGCSASDTSDGSSCSGFDSNASLICSARSRTCVCSGLQFVAGCSLVHDATSLGNRRGREETLGNVDRGVCETGIRHGDIHCGATRALGWGYGCSRRVLRGMGVCKRVACHQGLHGTSECMLKAGHTQPSSALVV